MKKQPKENEFVKTILDDAEALADALERIDEAIQALNGSRLKRKAILVLLANYTKLPQSTIDLVLEGLLNIKRTYLK